MTVDDVEPEDEGDAQAGFFDGDVLKFFDGGGGVGVEDGADLAAADFAVDVFTEDGSGDVEADGQEVELADFFFEGHLGHEPVDEAVHFFFGLCGLKGGGERGK